MGVARAQPYAQARPGERGDLDARRVHSQEVTDAGGGVRLLVADLGMGPQVGDQRGNLVVRGKERLAHPGCGSVAAAQLFARSSRSRAFAPSTIPAATTTANTTSRFIPPA